MTDWVQDESQLGTGGGKHEIYLTASHPDEDNTNLTHTYVWWFEPAMATGPEDARLRVSQFIHKKWNQYCEPTKFAAEHDGEEIVETVGWADEKHIGMDDVPDQVIERLLNWFGTDLIKRSVEYAGGTLPENIYECRECNTIHRVTPRQTCPDCGLDQLVKHVSEETLG